MATSRRFNRILTGAILIAAFAVTAAEAVQVKIISWNIFSYNDPGNNEFAALERIVQALDPDVILFQEANNALGRNKFLGDFHSRYPYNYLGPPYSENPRNHILSAYPIKSTGMIYCKVDDTQNNFERPTIWAELDLDNPPDGAADVRVFTTHYKSGSTSDDGQTRLNQATEDDAVVAGLLGGNGDYQIFYAGDLNSQIGDAPLNKIQLHLTRLSIIDLNNGSPVTYPSSGRTIDHMLYSAALEGRIINRRIFNTATGTPPPPAQPGDSALASDHLTLFATVDFLTSVTRYPPAITAAVSRKPHGTAGNFDVDVFSAQNTEPRKNGPTQLVVTFDRPIQQLSGTTNDVTVSSGTVSALAVNGNQLTITMSGVLNANLLSVQFPGIATAGNPSAVCTATLCLRVLLGDASCTTGPNPSTVDALDLVYVRTRVGQTITTSNFRADVNADGIINALDLVSVRVQIGRSVIVCP
jgi:endonuclease/exonuclease/phosphatase family metal-dependent hydrolase